MSWTDVTYAAYSALTSSKMTQLYDNFAHIDNRVWLPCSRDIALATGNASYTGAGFQPSKATVYGVVEGLYYNQSHGRSGVTSGHLFGVVGDTYMGYIDEVRLVSFDADGVTLNWTKVSSASGSYYVNVLLEG